MKTLKINYLAVLVMVILGQLIPMGWYTLFQEKWMAYTNLTMEMGSEAGATPYLASIVYSAFLAWALSWVFTRMKVESAMDGLKSALILGFPVTILYNIMQNLFSMRPYGLSWIDGGCGIIMFAVAGLVLGGWRKYDAAPGA
ncbi:MAG TPA: DUF1761 domain-containing protein [Cyclobacteriaceae bacterium]|nr:DUF1761 domain-containing protein [Cyclobacteriaceae bacterium]